MSSRPPFGVCIWLAVACGSSGGDALFGPDTPQEAGEGGMAGASTGGTAGATATGGQATTGGTSGGPNGTGGTFGGGGTGAVDAGISDGAVTGAGGVPPLPEGAWSRCNSDADCLDDRVCTQSAANTLAPGLKGACVHTCFGSNASLCDPGPPNASVVCTQIFVLGLCSIACGPGGSCPDGMQCATGYCWYLQ